MNIEDYRKFCLSRKGATESTPFSNAPDVLVFKVKGKMFCVTDIMTFTSFSVKCHPDEVDELRAKYPSVQEPSYFSKKHWNKVLVDGSIGDAILYEFIETSYNLVVAQLPKKIKMELLQ